MSNKRITELDTTAKTGDDLSAAFIAIDTEGDTAAERVTVGNLISDALSDCVNCAEDSVDLMKDTFVVGDLTAETLFGDVVETDTLQSPTGHNLTLTWTFALFTDSCC